MSVRADLAAIIRQHEDWDAAADEDWDAAADAVLDYLGQLDPDADPELITLHLRDSREEIARLREQRDAVLALHQPGAFSHCDECEFEHPCPTDRALTEEEA